MTDENKVRDALDAAKGFVEAVPIYQDALQPAVKEVGKDLQTIAKTIHVVLAPVSGLVWGYEQISSYITEALTQRLKHVPKERLITPSPMIAGPALESLRYAGHDNVLRELYANLLATAIDSETAKKAHPSFVEILRQLSPDEARILGLLSKHRQIPIVNILKMKKEGGSYQDYCRWFSLIGIDAKCDCPELTPTYVDNICRLGLAEVPETKWLTDSKKYEVLEKHPAALKMAEEIEKEDGVRAEFQRRFLNVTALGRQFLQACVAPGEIK